MEIERRIERLERENRKLKWTMAALVAVGLGALLMAQAAPEKIPEVVRAKEFQVIRDDSLPVVIIGQTRKGNGMVETRNGNGRQLVAISANGDNHGAILTLDGDGHTLTHISSSKSPGSCGVITLFKGGAKETVILASTIRGQGTVAIKDGEGKELVKLSSTEPGGAGPVGTVTTRNGAGKPVVRMGVAEETGAGMIVTHDVNGIELTRIGGDVSGYGGIMGTFSKTGQPTCALLCNEVGDGQFVVIDHTGKERTFQPGP